jgi:hypothetical protein
MSCSTQPIAKLHSRNDLFRRPDQKDDIGFIMFLFFSLSYSVIMTNLSWTVAPNRHNPSRQMNSHNPGRRERGALVLCPNSRLTVTIKVDPFSYPNAIFTKRTYLPRQIPHPYSSSSSSSPQLTVTGTPCSFSRRCASVHSFKSCW